MNIRSFALSIGTVAIVSSAVSSAVAADDDVKRVPADATPPMPAAAQVEHPQQGTTDVYITQAAPVNSASPNEVVPFKHFSVTWNPLALVLLRASLNFEWLPARHHAIVVNPAVGHIEVSDNNSNSSTYLNYGGEIGYKFYSGAKGSNGFFAGASFLAQRNQVSNTTNGVKQPSTGFTTIGGALDIGGQHVFDNGFTIGGGAGLMYVSSETSGNETTSRFLKFKGFLPRILLQVGYSF